MRIENGEIEFDRKDVWDYSVLGNIMIKWLETYKKYHNNCPVSYLIKTIGGNNIEIAKKEDHEAADNAFIKDIDDLIWALGNNEPEHPDNISKWLKELEKYEKERKEKLKLFAKLYLDLWLT